MAKTGFYFFHGDYYKDTRQLSLAARGGWVDLFGPLYEAGGTIEWPISGYARFWGVDNDQAMEVLVELQLYRVAEIEFHEEIKSVDEMANMAKPWQTDGKLNFAIKNGKNILPLAKLSNVMAKVSCRKILRNVEKNQHNSTVRREAGKKGAEKRWQTDGKNGSLLNLTLKNKNKSPKSESTSDEPAFCHQAQDAAKFLSERVVENHPGGTVPTPKQVQQWAKEATLIHTRDHHSYEEIMSLLDWATRDPFWRTNILSMGSFRKQWNRLYAQRKQKTATTGPQRDSKHFFVG